MKQYVELIFFLLFFSAIIFAFIPPKHHLPGKWAIYNSDGTSGGEYVDLKNDGIYTVYLPDGKIGETGAYQLKHHIFSIRNDKNVCGKGYWGKYRLDFHGDDSIHFMLIADTCASRRYDIVGVNPGLTRIKENE
jgi:hypothetical protein